MKINDSKDLGAAIRARRKQLGLTQSELASVSGCSLTFLSDLERGKPTAELGKAILVVSMLGVDMLFEQRGAYSINRKESGTTSEVPKP
jgi:y4mF family transcriptional regulator